MKNTDDLLMRLLMRIGLRGVYAPHRNVRR